jgi:hypothetical protein
MLLLLMVTPHQRLGDAAACYQAAAADPHLALSGPSWLSGTGVPSARVVQMQAKRKNRLEKLSESVIVKCFMQWHRGYLSRSF